MSTTELFPFGTLLPLDTADKLAYVLSNEFIDTFEGLPWADKHVSILKCIQSDWETMFSTWNTQPSLEPSQKPNTWHHLMNALYCLQQQTDGVPTLQMHCELHQILSQKDLNIDSTWYHKMLNIYPLLTLKVATQLGSSLDHAIDIRLPSPDVQTLAETQLKKLDDEKTDKSATKSQVVLSTIVSGCFTIVGLIVSHYVS